MSAASANVASTAYMALDDRIRSQVALTLDDLVGDGTTFPFKLQTWDGQ